VTLYDFAGLAGGLGGLAMFLVGVVVATLAALRLAIVARRPGKGRVARAVAASGGVLAAAGAALFWLAELAPFRRSVDRATGPLALVALALAALAGWRVGRRRPAPAAEPADADRGAPAEPSRSP
jgi:hypothetical protein